MKTFWFISRGEFGEGGSEDVYTDLLFWCCCRVCALCGVYSVC